MAAPLTREHLAQINDALKVSKDIKVVVARAKAAGIDVDEMERTLLENEKKLAGIKAAFFPAGR
ncbi:hypothetical protein CMI37_29480 [Candidatus Pacearchaeota archaeon]|nr:hypothetical protein [Candidatus Pacearchaeota archaeon]|tara:strand:- start:6007 stop:6198 length:192 start_codon:yes stop_codon:yes gene_type:complete